MRRPDHIRNPYSNQDAISLTGACSKARPFTNEAATYRLERIAEIGAVDSGGADRMLHDKNTQRDVVKPRSTCGYMTSSYFLESEALLTGNVKYVSE